ncbi:hypothetical protein [Dyella sp.]|uniref:hypothetical protein n=1 Tax=Dyella sp. TaxID=1869338 RepID=UPI002ED61C96
MKNDLARYEYLSDQLQRLSNTDWIVGQQLAASLECELGLYNEAVHDFPFDNRARVTIDPSQLPTPGGWHVASAADTITTLAAQRRLVMVNEVHHDAHTRELTLQLLPRLRKLGFNYFAAEALDDKDSQLMRRGYPVAGQSSYLHEPLYGEIVREAIRLGYIIVPYESSAASTAEREQAQAENLYRRVFAHDPHARLLVHAGYAHIDKAPGALGGNIMPMAMHLERLSGIEPLTVDQSQLRDIGGHGRNEAYRQLTTAFSLDRPSVLVNNDDGRPWSSDAHRHDVSVLLPPIDHRRRPAWISLGGVRQSRLVNTTMCDGKTPCLVEAHYASEGNDATAADRIALLVPDSVNSLFLYPGDYRVTASDGAGHTLSERKLHIEATTP